MNEKIILKNGWHWDNYLQLNSHNRNIQKCCYIGKSFYHTQNAHGKNTLTVCQMYKWICIYIKMQPLDNSMFYLFPTCPISTILLKICECFPTQFFSYLCIKFIVTFMWPHFLKLFIISNCWKYNLWSLMSCSCHYYATNIMLHHLPKNKNCMSSS